MARKVTDFAFPKLPGLPWYLGLVALLLICGGLADRLMLSGSKDTRAAFGDGRRVLVDISNGKVEGKLGEYTPPAAPVETAKADIPAPAAATENPSDKPAETAEATATSTPETEAVPAVDSLSAAPAAGAATVPLAGLKSGLTQDTPQGPMPVIGSDGTKPWRYYAKPFKRVGTLPMVAIIVTGLGEGHDVTESATKLPENVTLSFSPYAHDLASWMASARGTGHEVMLDLPLEPANYPASDPGPDGLLLSKDQAENAAHLQWLMTRAPGYIGFLTPQDEVFSNNSDAFKTLLQTLSTHGLLLAIGREPGKTDTRQTLDSSTTAAVVGDVLLDEDLAPNSVATRLATLEQVAKNRGYAIGIARAYPVTLDQVNAWAQKLAKKGVVLVPVSAIAKLRFS